MQGCKESRNPFPSEWEVWKRFFQSVVSFSNVEKLVLQVFESIKFQGEMFRREFFELLKISTLKFKKVCGREFFDSLNV